MKIFISWSGLISNKMAEVLKKLIPDIVSDVELFYSTEDINKGKGWDEEIRTQLEDSFFGIICLTNSNVKAPWINFEAGGLSKTFDSNVATLMVNIVTTDIQGPLKKYQATSFEKEDFFRLVKTINSKTAKPSQESDLSRRFERIWPEIREARKKILEEITEDGEVKDNKETENSTSVAIQEILGLLRNPQNLLPPAYIEQIFIDKEKEVTPSSLEIHFKKLYNNIQGMIVHILQTDKRDDYDKIYLQILDIINTCSEIMTKYQFHDIVLDFTKLFRIVNDYIDDKKNNQVNF